MYVEQAIKDLSKKMAKQHRLLCAMIDHAEEFDKGDYHLWFDSNVTTSCIVIRSLEELGEARRRMRGIFGKWNDKLVSIWDSGTHRLASWEDEETGFEIRLDMLKKDFPKELKL